MLGRRGPAQGAYTPLELKELGELEDADIIVYPDEAELDELSAASLADADRGTLRNVEIIQDYAQRDRSGKPRKLYLRFLVSPTELIGDEAGGVKAMRLVQNELYSTEAGSLRSRATDRYEEIPVGLVFRSIGYRGVPIPGVPFNDRWGVIPNEGGRVIVPESNELLLGHYTAGWIKRGPSGVIGTNKPDAAETADKMVEDVAAGRTLDPATPNPQTILDLIASGQPDYVTIEGWRRLDELELAHGEAIGRPRLKFTRVEDMIAALRETEAVPG
jgi:ferredoxin--NADP+ reductase